MRKKISIFLAFSQILIPIKSQASYDNFDFEQYMRNAQNAVKYEKDYFIPTAITQQYAQSLFVKSDYIDKIYKQYVSSLQELDKNLSNFNQKYNLIDINNVNSLEDFKKLLTSINNVSKVDNKIKNNVYTYRKFEDKLLELKDSFKDYCTKTSSLENANALTFEPLNFALADMQFKPVYGSVDDSINNEGKVQQPFFAIIGGGVIAGVVLSAIGATGVGLIVVAAAVIAAYITAFFINLFKQNEEQEKYDNFKRKVEQKFKEANDWYKQNSIIYKPDEIKKMAYDICTIDKPFQIFLNSNNEKSLYSVKKSLDELINNVDNYLIQIKKYNGNIEYSKENSAQLLNLFSLNSGVIPEEKLKNYNDNITKYYTEVSQKINRLNENIYQIKNTLAKKLAKKDMDKIQNKLNSDAKLIELQNIIFSNIRDDKVKKLFHIFIKNRDNCEKFSFLTDITMNELEETMNNSLKKNVDKYNKNNHFIAVKIPKMLEITKNYSNFRKKIVCGEE